MMARMKRASSRVISIFALGAALLSGCENDYDELTEDLLDGGWGDPAPMLPTCVPPVMEASTPTPDASTGDASTQDSAVSDAGTDAGNGDGSTNADASAAGDTGSPDSGSGDGG